MNIETLPETRLEFLWLRLAVSGVLLALLIGVVRLAWYPGLYFHLGGTWKFIAVLVAAALVAGPGLTTLLYRRDKKGMKFDILAIFVIEILAIGAAGASLYERRPEFLVFAIDRFETVGADQVSEHAFRFAELAEGRRTGPSLAIARFPDETEERAALKYEILFEGAPDIDRRPDQWYPYENGAMAVVEKARELSALRAASKGHRDAVDRWLGTADHAENDYLFVPVSGKLRFATMIIDRDSGQPVGMIDVDPWI